MIELPKYLQSKISPEPNTGCWLWFGAWSSDDYGSVGVPGTGKTVRAHRAVYEFYKGPIPSGLVLDHLCRMHCCVNPEHLEPVTDLENILRGVGAGAKNTLKSICGNGHSLENAIVERRPNRRPSRRCRECNKLWQKYTPRAAALQNEYRRRKAEEMRLDNVRRWENSRNAIKGETTP